MESHLLQMRGLKQELFWCITLIFILVASFTDAWIETRVPGKTLAERRRRIFYRCVD